MEIDDVFDELHNAAANLGMVAPDFGTSKGKAYEIWIMLEIVARSLARGIDVIASDRDDQLEPVFRVSGSPADMPAKSAGGGGPCHFKLRRGYHWLELHLGLNNLGISTTTHEIDLTIIPGPAGFFRRLDGGGPFEGPLLIGLELKAYSTKYKLDHGVPRALLGVALDLDPIWAIDHWTIHTVGGGARSIRRLERMHLAVMTATQLHDSSQTLLTHHGAGAHSLVTPGNNEAGIDAIVDLIDAALP